MTMTPAPISVERFDHDIGQRLLDPATETYRQVSVMNPSDSGEYVRHSDYATLLQQLANTEGKAHTYLEAASGLDLALTAANAKLAEREAEVERLRGLLGRCYVLAGADTDGEPPERHAEGAVRAVNDLRHDYDETGDECERLRQAVMHQEGKASEWCIRASVAQRDMKEACDSWHMAFVSTVQSLLIKDGMKIEQARIHAEVQAGEIRTAISAFLAASGGA